MGHPRPSSEHFSRVSQKLERELGEQILSCLKDASVIEIMLNPDGALWVERFGHPMARLGEIPPHQAEAAMATIAALHKTAHEHGRVEQSLAASNSENRLLCILLSSYGFQTVSKRACLLTSVGGQVESKDAFVISGPL